MPGETSSQGQGTSTAIEIAQMKEQIKSIDLNVIDIKRGIEGLLQLDKTIAELHIYSRQHDQKMESLFKKYDTITVWQQGHEKHHTECQHQCDKMLIESKEENREAIASVDRELQAWINSAKGAAWALGIVLGVLQVIVLCSIGWVFNNVSEMSQSDKLQALRIERLEQSIQPSGSKK